LDRHQSEEIFLAKKYFAHQPNQIALLPIGLKPLLIKYGMPQSQIFYFTDVPLQEEHTHNSIFTLENNSVYLYNNGIKQELLACSALKPITFSYNWLILISAAYLLGLDLHCFMPLQSRIE
jgi:hypothetical protein